MSTTVCRADALYGLHIYLTKLSERLYRYPFNESRKHSLIQNDAHDDCGCAQVLQHVVLFAEQHHLAILIRMGTKRTWNRPPAQSRQKLSRNGDMPEHRQHHCHWNDCLQAGG